MPWLAILELLKSTMWHLSAKIRQKLAAKESRYFTSS